MIRLQSHHPFSLLAFLLFSLFAAGLAGAEKAPDRFTVEGVSVSSRMEGTVRVTILTDATVKRGEVTFSGAQMIVRSEGNQHEFASDASPRLYDPVVTITGDKMHVHTDKAPEDQHLADFTGHAHMEVAPNTKDAKAKDHLIFTADNISYDYAARTAHLTGNATLQVGNSVIKASELTFEWKG